MSAPQQVNPFVPRVKPGQFKMIDVRVDLRPTHRLAIFLKELEAIPNFLSFSLFVVSSWQKEGEAPIDLPIVSSLFDCMNQLYRMMHFEWGKQFDLVTLLYVNQVIQRVGKKSYQEIFFLMCISSMLVAKFWAYDEDYIDCDLFCFVTGMSRSQMKQWELDFLRALEYALYLRESHVEAFVVPVLKAMSAPRVKEIESVA